MIDRIWLVERGFVGFMTVAELRAYSLAQAPSSPGVYAVLRESTEPPEFLARSIGGHFKGRDPTVPVARLEAEWVPDSQVIYFGKAGGAGKGSSIRRRLKQYLDFGNGKSVGHWGGRFIWQLANSEEFVMAWRETRGCKPRNVEKELIDEFKEATEMLPFANLIR